MDAEKMANESCRDHAATIWAQRNDRLLVTVSLSDCKDPSIEFKSDSLNISGHGGVDQIAHKISLEFFKEIDPDTSKYAISQRNIRFSIVKKESGPYWPRLLKEKQKFHWLKTDFDHWKDEDDSDVEAGEGGDGGTENFEQMMQKMGNFNPGAEGDFGGGEDEEDSDDEEMPDLESS